MSRDFSLYGRHPEPGERLLNYIWINRNKHIPDGQVCRVPLHHLDFAIENARRYPTVQVNLWLDRSTFNDYTDGLVSDQLKDAPDNLKECDLNDVPAYTDPNSIFRWFNKGSIDALVDLLRLHVIDHCFQTTDARDIFYSDFDIKNAHMSYWRLNRALDRHGMAFSRTEYGLENGMIGLRRNRVDFLRNTLLPRTIKKAKENKNGWYTLVTAVEEWAAENNIKFPDFRLGVCTQMGRGHKPRGYEPYVEAGVKFEDEKYIFPSRPVPYVPY